MKSADNKKNNVSLSEEELLYVRACLKSCGADLEAIDDPSLIKEMHRDISCKLASPSTHAGRGLLSYLTIFETTLILVLMGILLQISLRHLFG